MWLAVVATVLVAATHLSSSASPAVAVESGSGIWAEAELLLDIEAEPTVDSGSGIWAEAELLLDLHAGIDADPSAHITAAIPSPRATAAFPADEGGPAPANSSAREFARQQWELVSSTTTRLRSFAPLPHGVTRGPAGSFLLGSPDATTSRADLTAADSATDDATVKQLRARLVQGARRLGLPSVFVGKGGMAAGKQLSRLEALRIEVSRRGLPNQRKAKLVRFKAWLLPVLANVPTLGLPLWAAAAVVGVSQSGAVGSAIMIAGLLSVGCGVWPRAMVRPQQTATI